MARPLRLPAPTAAPARPSQGRRRLDILAAQQRRTGVLFSLPVLVLEGLLLALPILEAFYYSMTNWNGLSATWVGPGTYVALLSDPTFWRVLLNNAGLLLAVPVAIAIPLGVAFLLNEHVAGWKFFRSVYFLPTAISWVVIGMVSVQFFAANGILNQLLKGVGLGFLSQNMLSGEVSALVAVAITFIWSVFGTNTIIFITGMATLDPALYEAARVDGASSWQIIRYVTIPLLARFIQFAFITTLITAFTALFSLIFVMTGGGPGYGTTTLEFFIYQQAFDIGNFGFGATLGVVLFVIVFAISIAQLRLLGSGRE
jgi:multiple sugar transport system permease protein